MNWPTLLNNLIFVKVKICDFLSVLLLLNLAQKSSNTTSDYFLEQ